MSPMRLLASHLAAALLILPAAVSAQEVPGGEAVPTAFEPAPLTDPELEMVVGQGSPRGAFWKTSANEQIAGFDQQSALNTRITFDNWFNDVGSPMIWNNVLSAR